MGNIVVIEFAYDANIGMRDVYKKIKEIDSRCRVICGMSFQHWIELNGYDKEDFTKNLLAHPLAHHDEEGNITKMFTIEEYENFANFIHKSKITPIEETEEYKNQKDPSYKIKSLDLT